MTTGSLLSRIRKSAPLAILGLMVVAAGIMLYAWLAESSAMGRIVVAIILISGVLCLAYSFYVFVVSDTSKERKSIRASDFDLWFRTGVVVLAFGALFAVDEVNVIVILGTFSILGFYCGTAVHYLGLNQAHDERRVQINTRAALYSLYTSLFCMYGLFTADYLLGLHLSLARYFSALVLVVVISLQGFNVYLSRRSDVA